MGVLRQLNHRTETLRSKSWDEFAWPAAPPLEFIFTVCDAAAGEVCPAGPSQPMTAERGVPDPVAFVGSADQQQRRFRDVYFRLERRIQIFTNLPLVSLKKLTLQRRLDDLGKAHSVAPAEWTSR